MLPAVRRGIFRDHEQSLFVRVTHDTLFFMKRIVSKLILSSVFFFVAFAMLCHLQTYYIQVG